MIFKKFLRELADYADKILKIKQLEYFRKLF
jgi:hypothetical protein